MDIYKMRELYNDLKTKVESDVKDVVALESGSTDIAAEFAEQEIAQRTESVVDSIDEAIRVAAEAHGFEIKPHQIELAKLAAESAVNPTKAIKSLAKEPVNVPDVPGLEKVEVGVPALYEVDAIDTVTAMESFTGRELKPTVEYSVLMTLAMTSQDDVAELFFPIVPVDPKSAGASITIVVPEIYRDIARAGAGKKTDFGYKSLIKALNNPDEIDQDKNKLIPVVSDEAADAGLILSNLATNVDYYGESVDTAPLAVGKEIEIITLGTPESILAKGILDRSDVLDPHVNLAALVASVTGTDDSGNEITEYFRFDTSMAGAVWTNTPTGRKTQLQLNKEVTFTVKIPDTPKYDGSSSTILGQLSDYAGYSITFKAKLKGDGDTQDGTIALYVVGLEVVGVYNAAGDRLATSDQAYTDITSKLATLSIVGYEVDAYAANLNARMDGITLTTRIFTEIFTVPYRTNYSVYLPGVDDGPYSDLHVLNANVIQTRAKMRAAAFKTLDKFSAYLASTNAIDVQLAGVSDKLVDPLYVPDNINLLEIVEGISSSTRKEDVAAALINYITLVAYDMYQKTNYGAAFEALYPGRKPTVIVGMGVKLASLFGNQTRWETPKFDVVIASSIIPNLVDRIIFSFGIMDPVRNKEAIPMNFGQCFYSPDMLISYTVSEGNKTLNRAVSMSRFLHVPNLPIFADVRVTGINEVFARIGINTHSV